jgi:uncharacterized protein YndB with AHSA1/START domain
VRHLARLVLPTALTLGLVVAADAQRRGAGPRKVDRHQVVVDAPPSRVWRCWTTKEGIASFFAPDARIELEVGGAYELYMLPDAPEGQRGGEGCRVLAFVPHEVLAFSWNAPPSIPGLRAAGARTQVVLLLAPVRGGRTRVTLVQHGYGEGADWKKYRAYFGKAWPYVLGRLKKKLARPKDPKAELARLERERAALVRRLRALEESAGAEATRRELAELERALTELGKRVEKEKRRDL